MLKNNQLMAFVGTVDKDKAKKFYRDTLGLKLVKDQSPFALVFDCAGIMLRVSIVPKLTPAGFTVLGWHTDNVVAEVKKLAKRGVVFERYPGMEQDEHGVWQSPDGAKIAWFKDPDGNVLSLAQLE